METKDIPIIQDAIIKEIPQSFDHQILLYAKHWYNKSGNIIQDLKILLAKYAWLDTKHISDNEVRRLLCDCFAKYAPKHDMGRWIQDMLGWGWMNKINPLTPEQVMIGALSIAEGKYVDPTQLLPVLEKKESLTNPQ